MVLGFFLVVSSDLFASVVLHVRCWGFVGLRVMNIRCVCM
jgi:hypothetical protein